MFLIIFADIPDCIPFRFPNSLLFNQPLSEQSRRDDLESLGYVLAYFLRGSLPWQGLKAPTKNKKYEIILEKKISTSTGTLCKGFPAEFRSYYDHVRSLQFDDRPDYDYLKRVFRELFFRKGFTYDNAYDWEEAVRSPFTTETSTDDKVPGVGDIGLEENLEDIDDTDNVKSASEH